MKVLTGWQRNIIFTCTTLVIFHVIIKFSLVCYFLPFGKIIRLNRLHFHSSNDDLVNSDPVVQEKNIVKWCQCSCYFAIISIWKKSVVFLWSKLESLSFNNELFLSLFEIDTVIMGINNMKSLRRKRLLTTNTVRPTESLALES